MLFHETTVKRPQVVEFIDGLAMLHADGKPIIVVLNNTSIHHNIGKEKRVAPQSSTDHSVPDALQSRTQSDRILWKQAKYHWRKFTTWTMESLLHEVGEIFGGYGEKFEIRYA